jgi:hypothetical protein
MWYTDTRTFWHHRAIFCKNGTLDFLPDHGGFREGQKTKERSLFVYGVMRSRPFKEWLKNQSLDSDDTFEANKDRMQFRATNNSSYGYCYLWAWETE